MAAVSRQPGGVSPCAGRLAAIRSLTRDGRPRTALSLTPESLRLIDSPFSVRRSSWILTRNDSVLSPGRKRSLPSVTSKSLPGVAVPDFQE